MAFHPPAHWCSHSGPSNWYRVSYPPHWRGLEADGVLRLLAADGSGMLTLSSLWVSEAERRELGALVDVKRLFARSRHVQRIDPPDLPYRMLAVQGEAAPPSIAAWLKAVLTGARRPRWRVWVIQHGCVCLVATFVPGERFDPEAETLAHMILSTVRMAEAPADPPGVFADRVLRLARDRFPLLDVQPGEEFQLKLGESNINLFNFYRSYVNRPDKFEEIVLPALTTVVQVQEWGAAQTEPPLEVVRERIMPMLYPADVWRQHFPNFVGAPWVADLMILYVVDESHAYWYIREDLLARWQLTHEELHALALENLERYFAEHAMEFALAGAEEGPRLLVPNRPDAYNAARLLSAAFRHKLRGVLEGDCAVGLPSRDFCVAVSLDCPQTLAHIRSRVCEDFAHLDHPLTPRLLLVSPDGVSEFPPDEG